MLSDLHNWKRKESWARLVADASGEPRPRQRMFSGSSDDASSESRMISAEMKESHGKREICYELVAAAIQPSRSSSA